MQSMCSIGCVSPRLSKTLPVRPKWRRLVQVGGGGSWPAPHSRDRLDAITAALALKPKLCTLIGCCGHFRENEIPDDHYIAVNAAATGTPCDCLFAVGDSQVW